MDEKFTENLIRAIAAELHVMNGMMCAREMFGKGYFALGTGEKLVVDQAVTAMVASGYQMVMTPEGLVLQPATGPVGFRPPSS